MESTYTDLTVWIHARNICRQTKIAVIIIEANKTKETKGCVQ